MDKSPAFPLYAGDFLSDSKQMAMGLAGAGALIRLMCVCWKEGSIPDNPDVLYKLAQANTEEFEAVWPKVRECFSALPDGSLVHLRLEKERTAKKEFRKKKSEAGKKGAEKRYSKDANGVAKKKEFSADVMEVFEYWREQRSKIPDIPTARATEPRLHQINARLKEGFTVADIKLAVDGCLGNQSNVEGGFIDLELICRSDQKIIQYRAWARKGNTSDPGHRSLREEQ